MKTLLSKFKSLLPPDVISLVENLNSRGIRVGFIGGVVRDFLIYGHISDDIDLEIRSDLNIDMIDLATKLNAKLNEEFKIITIQLQHHSIEIGLPRIEIFNKNDLSHKNFSFIHSQGYVDEFKRRDFTINAIMFEIYNSNIKCIDPLNGLVDIKKNTLRACSEHFKLDPVRYLRAYRFKLNTGFSFDDLLLNTLNEMNVENCSSFYILKEAVKSKKPLSFLNEINLISNFNKKSIYDTDKFKVSTVIKREPTLINKEDLLVKLSLNTKNILPFKKVSTFDECYEMLQYFYKNKLSLTEILYILNCAGLDPDFYNFRDFHIIDLNFNTRDMTLEQKKNKFLKLILDRVQI